MKFINNPHKNYFVRMSIISQIKRFVYNWARPNTNDSVSQCNSVNKGVGNDVYHNIYETFFKRMNEGSWKGEKQTLECLGKIMISIDRCVYHVVKGLIQSGKSQLMIYYSAWMTSQHDMNVIIMLRNQTADIKSLVDKFRHFKNEKGIRNMEVIHFAKYYNTFEIQDIIDKFCESKKVFIILGNAEQLAKLNVVVKEGRDKINPFTMCIDELDLNEKQDSTRFQKEFEYLKQSGMISHVLGVTGTALPVLFKKINQLTSEQVVSLDAPLNYKGIQNITFTEIDINDEQIITKTMVQMLKSQYAFFDKDSHRHPAILLIKDERVKINQVELMERLVANKKIRENWAVIVYNGDGIFVQLPGNRKEFQSKSINNCLQKLKDTYGDSIKYVAIISGDLASRGLSFVSEDYSWHLTHMIMCARNSSTGTNLMQYTRLCGCYNDDIPLEMFTSKEIQEELFAYDNLQERCVERCEDPLMDTDQLKDRLSKMKLDPKCVVRRPIDTRLKVKYQNLSNYDKIMCGVKIDAKNLMEAISKVEKEYMQKPVVMVKKVRFHGLFNQDNVRKIKMILKNKYGIKKYINLIDDTKYMHLYKNPFFVTSTYKKSMAMISNVNDNNIIEVYIKRIIKEDIKYNSMFLFETPLGIFLSNNTEKEQLEKLYNKYHLSF